MAPAPLAVGAAIDDGAFSNYQKFVIAATASMIVLDGMDGQLLANAIPSLTVVFVALAMIRRHIPRS